MFANRGASIIDCNGQTNIVVKLNSEATTFICEVRGRVWQQRTDVKENLGSCLCDMEQEGEAKFTQILHP